MTLRGALGLVCAALLGAVLATGLATRELPMVARPTPQPNPRTDAAALTFSALRSTAHGREEGEVRAGTRVIVRLRSSLGGLTAYERALIAAKRLNDLAAAGGGDVEVVVEQGGTSIRSGSTTLLTVDAETARQNQSSPDALAARWRDAIAGALSSGRRPSSESAPPGPPTGKEEASAGGVALAAILATAVVAPGDGEEPVVHFRARENRPGGREEGAVVVGQTTVLVIRTAYGELSPYERAIITAKRLNDFVEDYGIGGPIRVVTENGITRIVGGSVKIVTADEEAARVAGMPPEELAKKWLEGIRNVLAHPPGDMAPPHAGDPALDGAPGGASSTQPGEGPVAVPNVPTEKGTRVPLLSYPTGAEVGRAEVAGEQAGDCVAVVAVDAEFEGCATVHALVPVREKPEPGGKLSRLSGCRVVAVALRPQAGEASVRPAGGGG